MVIAKLLRHESYTKIVLLSEVELYPDNAKMAKQFQHADKRNIPYAVIVGEQEIESNVYSLKNLLTENKLV
jgi:histidyl-tRNA synthetase